MSTFLHSVRKSLVNFFPPGVPVHDVFKFLRVDVLLFFPTGDAHTKKYFSAYRGRKNLKFKFSGFWVVCVVIDDVNWLSTW